MPSPATILSLATTIANDYRTVAIGWHLCLGVFVAALLAGWRPSNRVAGYLLAAPILSVSGMAWMSGNPFNMAVFAALALLLIALASRLSTQPVAVASLGLRAAGAILVAFGSTYPHFLAADHWTAYTYAAPFGLLPCPTLSAVIGLTLVLGLLQSRVWSMTLAGIGLLYGAIGVFTLGVTLDYGLLAGAMALGAVATAPATWRPVRPQATPSAARS
jgi:hypothetical protein